MFKMFEFRIFFRYSFTYMKNDFSHESSDYFIFFPNSAHYVCIPYILCERFQSFRHRRFHD